MARGRIEIKSTDNFDGVYNKDYADAVAECCRQQTGLKIPPCSFIDIKLRLFSKRVALERRDVLKVVKLFQAAEGLPDANPTPSDVETVSED